MKRRDFIKTAGLTMAGASLASHGWTQTAARGAAPGGTPMKKPNILFIMCDQMCIDAIAAYRDAFQHEAFLAHHVYTPNLDELVRNGVSFLHSYTPNPVCSPARSSIFTGRWTSETGVIVNNIGIDKDVPNMGQWFGEHSNYRRVYCGKWHAGGPWNNPTVDGPRKIPGFETLPNGQDTWGRYMDYGISSSVEAFLRNYRDEDPFLAVASFMDPHDICFWTPAYPGRTRGEDFFDLGDALPPLPPNQDYGYQDLHPGPIGKSAYGDEHWRQYIYDYCRMVERLDANVGRLLNAVRDRGDDTLVVFYSDHGDGVGRHRRVQKWNGFQSDTRVPFIVYGPKLGVQQGVVDQSHVVNGVDIMPTLCDFAGIPAPPHCKGTSVRPLAEGRDVPWRSHTYMEMRKTGRIIVGSRYKYLMAYEGVPGELQDSTEACFRLADGTVTEFRPAEGRSLRRRDHRLLFDLQDDPWETVNLAADPKYRDVVEEMEAILHDEFEPNIIPGHAFTRA